MDPPFDETDKHAVVPGNGLQLALGQAARLPAPPQDDTEPPVDRWRRGGAHLINLSLPYPFAQNAVASA